MDYPGYIVFDAKRIIGRAFSDAALQADMKAWPYDVVRRVGDKPMIAVTYKGERRELAPEGEGS